MQRTVNSTKFTYVHNTIENGEIKSELKEVVVRETDEKKALRKAYKEVGNFVPIKVEQVSELYVLEDDIFFQYAHKVEG